MKKISDAEDRRRKEPLCRVAVMFWKSTCNSSAEESRPISFTKKGKKVKLMPSLWCCKGAEEKDTSCIPGNSFITVSSAGFLNCIYGFAFPNRIVYNGFLAPQNIMSLDSSRKQFKGTYLFINSQNLRSISLFSLLKIDIPKPPLFFITLLW